MSVQRCILLFLSAGYIAAFCYVYQNYLHSTYGEDEYKLIDRTTLQFATTFALATAPLWFYGFSKTASTILIVTTYTLYYIPSLIVIHYGLDRPYPEVFLLQGSLAATMCGLFVANGIPKPSRQTITPPAIYKNVIAALTVVMIGAVVVAYRDHMRLVSFVEVYDLRFENDVILRGNILVGYFITWLTYCFLPYALARGLIYKEYPNLALGIVGNIVIYASTGSKAAILTSVIFIFFYILMKWRGDMLSYFIAILTVLIVAVIVLSPDTDTLLVKSIFFQRTLGTAGRATVAYYEFFSTHSQTHLSQIGIIDGLTHSYPYGSLQIGQLFGVNSMEASFNAGFWASEGIASFGIVGLYFASLLMGAFMVAINYLARPLDVDFVRLWMCGLAIGLPNAPFSNMLATCGGIFVLLILALMRSELPKRSVAII